ncbi:MAG: tyrosine-type recombinase/integrase [Proteobacteria bacterium]|nr:tyrosine-type recombinase/integrase [Pseudomonadota bacterium]
MRWYVVLDVPVALRPIIGTARLVASTKTEDLSIAMVRRDAKLREWRGKFEEAKRVNADPLLAEALMFRNDPLTNYEVAVSDDEDVPYSAYDLKTDVIADRAGRIEETHGEAQALAFVAIARGEDDTIRSMFDQWQREGHVQPKERANRETVIKVFLAWLTAKKVVPTVRSVTRALAGQFVSEELIPRSRATAAKYLSTLRGLWKWMESKGVVKDFPWDRHPLPKRQLSRDEKKRAFTDEEVVKLLSGHATPTMHDMMMVAALSGMRLEEIAALRIKDISSRSFNIPRAKTLAGQRPVPIHSQIAALVARRSKGKGPDDRLFSDVSSESKLGKHAVAFSKAFTNYRRSIGVDEVPDGSRVSVVDFHSWRRWFITAAERAGIATATIQAVVGHKRGSLALDFYSEGPGFKLATKCVEAVRLPRLTSRPKAALKAPRRRAA